MATRKLRGLLIVSGVGLAFAPSTRAAVRAFDAELRFSIGRLPRAVFSGSGDTSVASDGSFTLAAGVADKRFERSFEVRGLAAADCAAFTFWRRRRWLQAIESRRLPRVKSA